MFWLRAGIKHYIYLFPRWFYFLPIDVNWMSFENGIAFVQHATRLMLNLNYQIKSTFFPDFTTQVQRLQMRNIWNLLVDFRMANNEYIKKLTNERTRASKSEQCKRIRIHFIIFLMKAHKYVLLFSLWNLYIKITLWNIQWGKVKNCVFSLCALQRYFSFSG